MTNARDTLMYRRLLKAGFVAAVAAPKPIANAVRATLGLPPYRALGLWLPPRAA